MEKVLRGKTVPTKIRIYPIIPEISVAWNWDVRVVVKKLGLVADNGK